MQVSGVARLVPKADGKAILEVAGRPRFELNPAAVIIWEGLAIGVSTQEIIAQIVARFNVPEKQAACDVSNCIELLKQHLLVYDETEHIPSPPSSPSRSR